MATWTSDDSSNAILEASGPHTEAVKLRPGVGRDGLGIRVIGAGDDTKVSSQGPLAKSLSLDRLTCRCPTRIVDDVEQSIISMC